METNRVGLDLFQKILSPDARSLHLLAFGAAFGSNIFSTFFVAPISLATLPKQQFSALMSKLFPSYYTFQAAVTGAMVATLAYDYSVIRKHPFDIMDATVYQAFTLATSAAAHLVNALVVAPASSKLMTDIQRQEKAEGKSFDDAGVSKFTIEAPPPFSLLPKARAPIITGSGVFRFDFEKMDTRALFGGSGVVKRDSQITD